MNKGYAILIMSFIWVLSSQASFANTTLNANKILYQKADSSLIAGDTLRACSIYKTLKIKTDSIAQINYQNEIKAKRTTYQIDELYLENKLQEGIILRRISLFLFITALLLISAFYYLRIHNRKLEQARLEAQRLKEDAEMSIEKKTRLLYAISKEMTESLTEMKEVSTNLQVRDAGSSKDVHNYLSKLHASEEKLKNIYNQIFS